MSGQPASRHAKHPTSNSQFILPRFCLSVTPFFFSYLQNQQLMEPRLWTILGNVDRLLHHVIIDVWTDNQRRLRELLLPECVSPLSACIVTSQPTPLSHMSLMMARLLSLSVAAGVAAIDVHLSLSLSILRHLHASSTSSIAPSLLKSANTSPEYAKSRTTLNPTGVKWWLTSSIPSVPGICFEPKNASGVWLAAASTSLWAWKDSPLRGNVQSRSSFSSLSLCRWVKRVSEWEWRV